MAVEEAARVDFKKETVSKLLSGHFKEDKTKCKLSSSAAVLMSEMLKVFVQEAAVRSLRQAESEDCDRVHIQHFEKILPQLTLEEAAAAAAAAEGSGGGGGGREASTAAQTEMSSPRGRFQLADSSVTAEPQINDGGSGNLKY
ncbi:hypothetical protein CRUP_008261 [Coryphaenoides rupestris]|nr:hypothetical protein CRUP_008261 [Coryphaenoides rupestris]